jgi:hypothetical protein
MSGRAIRIPLSRVMLSDSVDAYWRQAVASCSQQIKAKTIPVETLVLDRKIAQLQAVFGCGDNQMVVFTNVEYGHWSVVKGDA